MSSVPVLTVTPRNITPAAEKNLLRAAKMEADFYATGNKPVFMKRLSQLGIELPDSLFAQRQLTPDMSIGPMTVATALEMQEERA